jgi:hypothetical protein
VGNPGTVAFSPGFEAHGVVLPFCCRVQGFVLIGGQGYQQFDVVHGYLGHGLAYDAATAVSWSQGYQVEQAGFVV